MNLEDNKFVDNSLEAHTKRNESPAPTFQAPSHGFTLGPTPLPAPTLSLGKYIDKNLQKATKLTLESFLQGQQYQAELPQDNIPRKQFFKPCFPVVYLNNLYIECYKFYQQYEDYFDITRAKELN